MKKRLACWSIIGVMMFSGIFSMAAFAEEAQPGGEAAIDLNEEAADSWAQSAAAAQEAAEAAEEGADTSGESAGDSAESAGESAAAMREAGYGDILDFDWAGYFQAMSEKTASGEQMSAEDALPDAFLQMFEMMINSPDNLAREEGVTVDFVCEGNEIIVKNKLSADLDEKAVEAIVEARKETYESEQSGLDMKDTMEQIASGYSVDINAISIAVQVIGSDEEVLYEKLYRYEDVKDLQRAPAAEAAEDAAVND